MARVALVADIHANLHALRAVMKEVEGADVDMVLCAGDVVGYGPFPNECCEELRAVADRVVRGNHDRSSLNRDTSGMNPYAAAAALWTADNLDGPSREFLSGLTENEMVEVEGARIALWHGSPMDPDEYVYEEDAEGILLERADAAILVLGHTHCPFVKQLPNGLIVNPGSVGQPRDGDPRASYAILDADRRRCDVIRVEYPVKEASDAIVSKGLPLMLAQRLWVGR